MKTVIKLSVFLFLGLFVFASCGDSKKSESKEETTQMESHDQETIMEEGSEELMAYACPMACEKEKTYTEEGKCPVCKMNLEEVAVADTQKEEE